VACQGCINRQRKLVEKLCKSPDSWLCRKAKARLERMLGDGKPTERKSER
jgi:hypothetical protein